LTSTDGPITRIWSLPAEATAARTSASCVDDVDDDQGVAVVEIEVA